MKNIKLLMVTVASLGSSCVFTRQFDINLNPNAGFMTKQSTQANEYQRIDISGNITHRESPSYRHISGEILKNFNLDARAKDLEIMYVDATTGDSSALKDEIRKKSPKKREEFFNSIQDGDGVIMLNVTKPGVSVDIMPIMSEEEMIENESLIQ